MHWQFEVLQASLERCYFLLRMCNGKPILRSSVFDEESQCRSALDALRTVGRSGGARYAVRTLEERHFVRATWRHMTIASSDPLPSRGACRAAIIVLRDFCSGLPIIDRRGDKVHDADRAANLRPLFSE